VNDLFREVAAESLPNETVPDFEFFVKLL
jgi:hypothetical protein